MADANYYSAKQLQQQQQQHHQQNQEKIPSKLYIYKAVTVAIFLVTLPLFSSQAPEFINRTVKTRGWEFLHLVFVGIAVSYGLFSKKNDETEKENNNNNNTSSKFDNAQSYVSGLLQISSVFDSEADSPPKYDTTSVQTWSNQYYRNEPIVVVAEEKPVLDNERKVISSRIGGKPLLLPVRSLKSRIVEADVNENGKESATISVSIARPRTHSKRFSSSSSKGREPGGFDYKELEAKLKDGIVLPSPIPWRSRSGRMEVKELKEAAESHPLYTLPPSSEESEFSRSFRHQFSRSSRPSSTNSSPKLSPSPSMSSPKKLSSSNSSSSEAQGKSAEDFVRKKTFYWSPPPPPPSPPPPPPMARISPSMKLSSNVMDNNVFIDRELQRSFTSEVNRGGGNLTIPKSVKTTRSRSDSLAAFARKEKEFEVEKRSKGVEASAMERSGRKTGGFEQAFMEFPEEKREEFVEGLVTETDEDSEIEEADDDDVADSNLASSVSACSSNVKAASGGGSSDGGPDVDKKADEFIAKFREQIRLQRIESIKRSSAQICRNTSPQQRL